MSSENDIVSIDITKEIPLFGTGDTLETRLRQVRLRGFPDVRIYEHARFETEFLTPEKIMANLHTPQPSIYEKNLKIVQELAKLFAQKGIDILNLEKAYDFTAKSSSGRATEWTMIPPIIERFHIPKNQTGGLNYKSLIGYELAKSLKEDGLWLNPDLAALPYNCESGMFNLINDGAHRVHLGYQNKGIKILKVEGMTSGYPYYAAPKTYSEVRVMPEPDETTTAMKVHIVQSPAQKKLYRLFPSGGIKTGEVRPATKGESFI